MDRDELMAEFRQRLGARSEDYFLEVFNMSKQDVVDPNAVWTLADLRENTSVCGSGGSENDSPINNACYHL